MGLLDVFKESESDKLLKKKKQLIERASYQREKYKLTLKHAKQRGRANARREFSKGGGSGSTFWKAVDVADKWSSGGLEVIEGKQRKSRRKRHKDDFGFF